MVRPRKRISAQTRYSAFPLGPRTLQTGRANFYRSRCRLVGILRSRTKSVCFQKIRWLKTDGGRINRVLCAIVREIPDYLDRGWLRRERLGRLEEIDTTPRK